MPASVFLADAEATARLGAALAGSLPARAVAYLHGDLGAGKTTLARALIRAMAGDDALEVPSPTFTLVQSYDTPHFAAHHFDLWRLAGAADLRELGWEEARAGVVLVEWPDRLGAHLPPGALRLDLSTAGEGRLATLTGGRAALREAATHA